MNVNLKADKFTLGDPEIQHWQKTFAQQLQGFEWATPTAELEP